MSEFIFTSEQMEDVVRASYHSMSIPYEFQPITCVEVKGERLPEIVRCRDCEFAAYEGKECMRIDEWDNSLWFPVEPDGFCAWGKKAAEE